ncbi:hypothetical protein CTEN210_16445 [Chaetoceros tenuissimus]|uniref:Ion transport domain-containing protein n=1 Tax=Chaetoceros tenuissimus TaxID=426638 RepID=A0AAD3DC77_9STRA|nr:hypothetical protein CTEN210_16445 [Chaetoceros tenuissimus]
MNGLNENPQHDDVQATFKELVVGYFDKDKGVEVDMSKKITSRYQKTDRFGKQVKGRKMATPMKSTKNLAPRITSKKNPREPPYTLYEEKRGLMSNQDDIEIYDSSLMGITLRQMKAVMANVERRCVEEGWKDGKGNLLSVENVSIKHVNKYVVEPFTKAIDRNASFVQCLPSCAGAQKPRFIASHSIDMPLFDMIDCYAQFVEDFSSNKSKAQDEKGGGMTEDTAIWIFTFAVRPWRDAPFRENEKAARMARQYAEYRTVTFLDRERKVFKRMWCVYDVYQALKGRFHSDETFWCIYTPFQHENDVGKSRKSVGIVPGGAPSDDTPSASLKREKHFPIDILEKLMKIDVKKCEAQEQGEINMILNAMKELKSLGELIKEKGEEKASSTPPEEHEHYEYINDAIRAYFATIGALKIAFASSDEKNGFKNNDEDMWKTFLSIMRKGQTKSVVRLDFRSGGGWDNLKREKAVELMENLPASISGVEIYNSNFGPELIEALAHWIEETSENLKTLIIQDTFAGSEWKEARGKDAIANLVKSLSQKKSQIKTLAVWGIDLDLLPLFVTDAKVVEALFSSLELVYTEKGLDKKRVEVLYTALQQCNKSNTDFAPHFMESAIEWSINELDEDPFLSESGYFLKLILNTFFTNRNNLMIIMVDLYVRLFTVIDISYWQGIDKQWHDARGSESVIIALCVFWLIFRELTQVNAQNIKNYICSFSNIIDLAQIVILLVSFWYGFDRADPNKDPSNNYHSAATIEAYYMWSIAVAWIALIYELRNFVFPLAVFVTALEQIFITLVPFLFTTVLVIMMFSHMYRAGYCPRVDFETPSLAPSISFSPSVSSTPSSLPSFKPTFYLDEPDWGDENGPDFQEIWCEDVPKSYRTSFAWFLSGDLWNFDKSLTYFYAFIIGVLFFNIVIAVVSNRFTDVQNDAEHSFWLHRYSLTQELYSVRTFFFFVPNVLKKWNRNGHSQLGRFDFLDEATIPEYNLSSSESAKSQARENELSIFLDWWLSPKDLEIPPPTLVNRIKLYFLYSYWQDIIFPNEVIERILRGLKRQDNIKGENMNFFGRMKVNITRFLVKMLMILVFILSLVATAFIILLGICTFGLAWPSPLTHFLFHAKTDPPKSSTENKVSKKDIDAIVQKRLDVEKKDLEKMIRRQMKEELTEMKEMMALLTNYHLS